MASLGVAMGRADPRSFAETLRAKAAEALSTSASAPGSAAAARSGAGAGAGAGGVATSSVPMGMSSAPSAAAAVTSAAAAPAVASNPTTLNVVEAFRFLAIIEEAKERLDLVGYLIAGAARRRDLTDANRNRSDIFSLLNKQQELEANFEAHMQKRGELRGLSNKSKFHQNEEELFRLVRQLKESGQSIATNLKDQPTLSGNVQKVQEDRSQLHELLQIAIDDLQHCSCDNLVLQVHHRQEQQKVLEDQKKYNEAVEKAVMQLQEKIDAEDAVFRRALEEKTAEINRLNHQLKHLKKVTAGKLQYEEDTARAGLEALKRERAYQKEQVVQEIADTEKQIQLNTIVNERSISFLERQKKLIDKLYTDWDGKYNSDFSSKSKMLDDLRDLRAAEKQKLSLLEARWAAETEEKLARLEELKKRDTEARVRAALLEQMDMAQRKIRFAWRVYKRKLLKLRKKKKKRRSSKKKDGAPGSPRPPGSSQSTRSTGSARSSPTSRTGTAAGAGAGSPSAARQGVASR